MAQLRENIRYNISSAQKLHLDDASVRKWVDDQLSAQEFSIVKSWAKRQYKKAGVMIVDLGSKPATEKARRERTSAKRYRRWLAKVLDDLERWKRIYRPDPDLLWPRNKIGLLAMSVAAYKEQRPASPER
jgi:hypothetical protein